jgi:hypothetical protein
VVDPDSALRALPFNENPTLDLLSIPIKSRENLSGIDNYYCTKRIDNPGVSTL